MNCDEWIPIRPGTTQQCFYPWLSFAYEYGYRWREHKRYTNGPYLVGADAITCEIKRPKTYDWDLVDGKAKPYDDTTIKDVAIEGNYSINGAKVTPAFALIKEHVKSTPGNASQISTIRRNYKAAG